MTPVRQEITVLFPNSKEFGTIPWDFIFLLKSFQIFKTLGYENISKQLLVDNLKQK